MGTDTDNPQARAKSIKKSVDKGLTLIKTNSYELRINSEGQFSRMDLLGKSISKVTDIEAKSIMLTKLNESLI
jgi:hypothetical protein